MSRAGPYNRAVGNFFYDLINGELSLNKELRKFPQLLVVLNVWELDSDFVLNAYLHRKSVMPVINVCIEIVFIVTKS